MKIYTHTRTQTHIHALRYIHRRKSEQVTEKHDDWFGVHTFQLYLLLANNEINCANNVFIYGMHTYMYNVHICTGRYKMLAINAWQLEMLMVTVTVENSSK